MELLATNRSQRDFQSDGTEMAGSSEHGLGDTKAATTETIDETTITLLKRSDLLAHEWPSLSIEERRSLLGAIVHQVELQPSRIRLTISRRGLRQALDDGSFSQTKAFERHEAEEARSKIASNSDLVTLERPVSLKKRGLEMRLVVGNRFSAQPDQALIDLIARAHAYLHDLTTIPNISLKEIAQRHCAPPSEVSRHLPLAFLSPELTEKILKGEQPPELTAHTLGRKIKDII